MAPWGASGTGLRAIPSLRSTINEVLLVQAHRDQAVLEGITVGESSLQSLNGQTVEMVSHSSPFSEERHDRYPSYSKYYYDPDCYYLMVHEQPLVTVIRGLLSRLRLATQRPKEAPIFRKMRIIVKFLFSPSESIIVIICSIK